MTGRHNQSLQQKKPPVTVRACAGAAPAVFAAEAGFWMHMGGKDMNVTRLRSTLVRPRRSRHAAILLDAAIVSATSLGSVVLGFWAYKVLGVANQIAVQVPASLVAGAVGIVAWFRFLAGPRAAASGKRYVLVVALAFPMCAIVLIVAHYLVTGYLTSFGNIAAAWLLLLCHCLIAAPVCSALARRAAIGQQRNVLPG